MKNKFLTSIHDINGINSNTDFNEEFLKTNFSDLTSRSITPNPNINDALEICLEAGQLYKLELEISKFEHSKLSAFQETKTYKKYFDENGLVSKAKLLLGDNEINGLSINSNDMLTFPENLETYRNKLLQEFKNKNQLTTDPKVLGSLLYTIDNEQNKPIKDFISKNSKNNKFKSSCMTTLLFIIMVSPVIIGAIITLPWGAIAGGILTQALSDFIKPKIEEKIDKLDGKVSLETKIENSLNNTMTRMEKLLNNFMENQLQVSNQQSQQIPSQQVSNKEALEEIQKIIKQQQENIIKKYQQEIQTIQPSEREKDMNKEFARILKNNSRQTMPTPKIETLVNNPEFKEAAQELRQTIKTGVSKGDQKRSQQNAEVKQAKLGR